MNPHRAWPEAKLVDTPDSGHSMTNGAGKSTASMALDTGQGYPPPPMSIEIVRKRVPHSVLERAAAERFGDMVKAVVDLRRRIMAIGGDLHADEETVLLDDGSQQADLWGINLYPATAGDDWLEFDSMINVRPAQGNRSRGVENPTLRQEIRALVDELVERA